MRCYILLPTVLMLSIGLSYSSTTADILVSVGVKANNEDEAFPAQNLIDGAATFDLATGVNGNPRVNVAGEANVNDGRGLAGYTGTFAPTNSAGIKFLPGLSQWTEIGQPGPSGDPHDKRLGIWMSGDGFGDHTDNSIDFELSGVCQLEQIWIWNQNDHGEADRDAKYVTLKIPSSDPGKGLVNGGVTYDVTLGTLNLTDPGTSATNRLPDVFTFPENTSTRYLRLFGVPGVGATAIPPTDNKVGLGGVLIFGSGPSQANKRPISPKHSEKENRSGVILDPVSPMPNKTEPHWQLFLDDHVIERSTGFRRVVHHPAPRGVVLEPDKPWETQGLSIMYVGPRKDGKLECYYRVHGATIPIDTTAYAVSDDGIHWEKPNLGLVLEGPGEEMNNLLPCGAPFELGKYGNISDPNKRFLIGLGDKSLGQKNQLYFAPELPDWENDPDWRSKLTKAGYKPSYKLGLHFWDDQHGEWVFMRQSPNHPPARCVARWATKDLQNWTLKPVFYPDAHDSSDPRFYDEIYGMHAMHTEGMVLGFAEWLIGDQTRPDIGVLGQELIGTLMMKGTMDVRVSVSRDGGFTWDRTVSREAWIPHGTEQDSYDRLVRLHASPLRRGDEDWFYCVVVDGDHGSGLGYGRGRSPKHRGALYVQKHNRYVSLTAGNIPQFLITKNVEVTGKTLQLNVDASRGEVRVGIGIDKTITIVETKALLPNYMVRDRQGRTHLEEGFQVLQCEPIHANSIEHEVKFEGGDLSKLMGKQVRLYIMVQDADLYGFRFR